MPKPPPLAYLHRHRWTAEDARVALSALAASGLSARAFGIREGLDPQRLRRWRQQLEGEAGRRRRSSASPGFVELRPSGAAQVEIVLRSGHVLRVAETIGETALARIVDVLERAPSC